MQNVKTVEQVLTSLEVAEMVGKEHKELLRDIHRYEQQARESNLALSEFWKESTYKPEGQKRSYPCYNISKKGCEFIAHKMTGVQGTTFTAKYINRFHEMEETIVNGNAGVVSNIDNAKLVETIALQSEMLNKQVELLSEVTKVLAEVKKEIRATKEPTKEEDTPLIHNPKKMAVSDSLMYSRTKRLNLFIGKLAKLSGELKSDIYCSLYTEIEKKFDVSLDSYLEVFRSEYTQDAHTINVVAFYDDFYDYSYKLLDNALSRYSTFDREDLL
ncbi:MAG: Rha family transcriptional regulator [Butyrivibrio sp.]|nr:Rha family transcriptional regulator [Butyrivibrio sp.]MBQ9305834.1 Rha family transcriptional regulator [Butyrivibrio sp.]